MKTKQVSIWGGVAVFITFATAFTLLADVTERIDPFVHTEAEAAEEHESIILAEERVQQTQAGFNAYTLRLLLEQEIAVLELQIEAEEDPGEKKTLEAELAIKLAFIEQLELEERKQMMKGGEG